MDEFYTYRPMLDLIGKSEGTDKGRGYNETLGYGAYTGGDRTLTVMTLEQIDKLQTQMLSHPKNSLKSSALGRYQIVRTTLRNIVKRLKLSTSMKFDEQLQDRMACFLLGSRGIDDWLENKMVLNQLITELAQEWASLPTPSGKGYYDGQRAAVTVQEVKLALNEVKMRYASGPFKPVPTPEPKPTPKPTPTPVEPEKGFWAWVKRVIIGV